MVSPINGAECPTGAHPGNTGGKKGRSGPKPDRVRRALLAAGANRIKVLAEIADGNDVEAKTSDRVKAIETMFKYGMGTVQEVTVDNIRARLAQTIELVRQELDPETAERLLARMSPIWK
jgi:hypothetical protein